MNSLNTPPPCPDFPARLYGRRQGRPLKKDRKDVLETLLPALLIPEDRLDAEGALDPLTLFEDAEKTESTESPRVWLEIGFGNGEHLAELIRRNPADRFIGAEPFVNGMSAFLKEIRTQNAPPVRVRMNDAMPIVRALTPESLTGIYILNPDPWPKTRHHKRRIVRPETLDAFARVLKPDGWLIMTSDVADLAEWMLLHSVSHPAFVWQAGSAADWRTPPPAWIPTRYEQKGIRAGRTQFYLVFKKKI